ncbi:hypothetical protein FB451DRAFT_1380359 [Mycena latifolia]|nr:hypothetical protein FB451DRAFT_1380359 [Mycena latifolia]
MDNPSWNDTLRAWRASCLPCLVRPAAESDDTDNDERVPGLVRNPARARGRAGGAARGHGRQGRRGGRRRHLAALASRPTRAAAGPAAHATDIERRARRRARKEMRRLAKAVAQQDAEDAVDFAAGAGGSPLTPSAHCGIPAPFLPAPAPLPPAPTRTPSRGCWRRTTTTRRISTAGRTRASRRAPALAAEARARAGARRTRGPARLRTPLARTLLPPWPVRRRLAPREAAAQEQVLEEIEIERDELDARVPAPGGVRAFRLRAERVSSRHMPADRASHPPTHLNTSSTGTGLLVPYVAESDRVTPPATTVTMFWLILHVIEHLALSARPEIGDFVRYALSVQSNTAPSRANLY